MWKFFLELLLLLLLSYADWLETLVSRIFESPVFLLEIFQLFLSGRYHDAHHQSLFLSSIKLSGKI